ncbi:hypothetical protein AB1K62_07015 [Parasphingorhabdus sp. JC815]|uniref:hypothetical protein n=1 Tax=Parasphingorhabdus sp. JC815 TaxID=3232140 RepID=UPI00345B3FEE
MVQSSDNKLNIAQNPEWLAHRYQPDGDKIHFVHATRKVHQSVTFISDEYLHDNLERRIFDRSEVVLPSASKNTAHFILHSGFCCSTLLARAFDIENTSMGLKEPVILQDATGYYFQTPDKKYARGVIHDVLGLLARPFSPPEATIIKPSCVVNGLAEQFMHILPESRAVIIHAPLPVFLGSIARKQITGRLWAREQFAVLHKMKLIDLGFDDEQYFRQTDLQIAAAGWLIQQGIFQKLIRTFGSDRIKSINSETLLEKPDSAISAMAQLYQLNLNDEQIGQIVGGPAFNSHSKHGTEFNRQGRREEQSIGESPHADEIGKVTFWAEKVAEAAEIEMILKAPLI